MINSELISSDDIKIIIEISAEILVNAKIYTKFSARIALNSKEVTMSRTLPGSVQYSCQIGDHLKDWCQDKHCCQDNAMVGTNIKAEIDIRISIKIEN